MVLKQLYFTSAHKNTMHCILPIINHWTFWPQLRDIFHTLYVCTQSTAPTSVQCESVARWVSLVAPMVIHHGLHSSVEYQGRWYEQMDVQLLYTEFNYFVITYLHSPKKLTCGWRDSYFCKRIPDNNICIHNTSMCIQS